MVWRDGGTDAIGAIGDQVDRILGSYEQGLWPSRYTRWEAASLKVQSRHIRRNVPLIWLWRYRNDDDRYGAAPDSTYYEEPAIDRRYEDPVGAHIRCDDTPKRKGGAKGVVRVEGECQVWITRAECIRLGQLFGVKDDREVTLEEEETGDAQDGPFALRGFLYIPRAGDIIMFRRKHLRIQQFEPDRAEGGLSPAGTIMAWAGTAVPLTEDASAPERLREQLVPPTANPVVPRTGRDLRWLG